MADVSRSVVVTIVNPQGLHLRPMHMFVQLASKYQSKIEILRAGERVDAKSLLAMMTLGAVQGTQLRVEADGPDAEAALDALSALVARGFGEMDEASTAST
jgi:phosphotransferase system HPr (HPr) family protein